MFAFTLICAATIVPLSTLTYHPNPVEVKSILKNTNLKSNYNAPAYIFRIQGVPCGSVHFPGTCNEIFQFDDEQMEQDAHHVFHTLYTLTKDNIQTKLYSSLSNKDSGTCNILY